MATAAEDLTDDLAGDIELEQTDDLPGDDQGGDDGANDNGDDTGEEEADVISFGDTSVAGEDEPEGVRNLRTRLREMEKENKALKAGKAPEAEDIGPEPNMDDFWDDPEGFKKAVREYDAKVAKRDEAVAKQRETTEAVEREISEAVTSYETQRASLKVPNFDGAHERVVEKLGESGANILRIVAGGKSAALTYALGNSPEWLETLSKFNLGKLTDVVKLAAEIGALAKETKVERRKPATQPESVHRGGSAGTGRDSTLERLEAEARRTGIRTALIDYKRKKGIA